MVTSLLAVAVAALAIGCSDAQRAPLGPREASTPSLEVAAIAQTRINVRAVQWKRPLTQSYQASALIGAEGGVLVLPQTGLRLVVPKGAVTGPTQFGVVARPGRLVAYDFSPAGSQFAVALRLEQDQNQIERPAGAPGHQPVLQLGYFASESDVSDATGTAAVTELNDMLQSSPAAGYAFPVHHFSGYIVSWGFR